MILLDLIRARSLAGSGTHTRADNLKLVAATNAVLEVTEAWESRAAHTRKMLRTYPADVQQSLQEMAQDFEHNARVIRDAIKHALETNP